MSSVQSAKGMVVGLGPNAEETYDIRTITKNRSSDDVPYVSSKTGGKTFRVPGNDDASWEISLYALSGMEHIPAELQPGQTIKVRCPLSDALDEVMIILSSSLEVDIAAHAIVGISLSCAAVSAASYVDNP